MTGLFLSWVVLWVNSQCSWTSSYSGPAEEQWQRAQDKSELEGKNILKCLDASSLETSAQIFPIKVTLLGINSLWIHKQHNSTLKLHSCLPFWTFPGRWWVSRLDLQLLELLVEKRENTSHGITSANGKHEIPVFKSSKRKQICNALSQKTV